MFQNGPAFAVYKQLSGEEKGDHERIKAALLAAFEVNCYAAYVQLQRRVLPEGETVDVYLADFFLKAGYPDGARLRRAAVEMLFHGRPTIRSIKLETAPTDDKQGKGQGETSALGVDDLDTWHWHGLMDIVFVVF